MTHGKNWRLFPGYIPGEMLRLHDPYAHALTVIDEVHRLTHDGMCFHHSSKVTGVANGASADFAIHVPAGAHPHMHNVRMQAGAGDIDFIAYEAPTLSDNGTLLTIHNLNRNSANTADTLLYGAPTVTDVGTEIHNQWAPPTAAGTGQTAAGVVNVSQGEEWILKSDTWYLFRVTNNSGEVVSIGMEMMFYEISYEEA